MGSATLSGNVATVAGPTTLAVGVHQLTATWAGDSNYAALNLAGTHTVTGVPLQVRLVSNLNPSMAGQAVLLATQFLPSPPAGIDLTGHVYTGTLSFYDGSTLLGQQQISTNGYNFSATNLSTGTRRITAVYSGDEVVAGATSNVLIQVVDALPSTAMLAVNPTASVFGGQIQLTATVSSSTPQSSLGVPTGTVTFYNGSAVIGSATLSSGVASLMTTILPVGTDQVTCKYSGDTAYLSSACNTVAVSIAVAPTTTNLTVAPSPGYLGQGITLSATTTSLSPLNPGGTVSFFDGSTNIGSSQINGSGMATLTTSSLAVGTHALTASYTGGQQFGSSTSPAIQEEILASSFSLTISPSSITVQDGQQGTATIQLASLGTFAGPVGLTYGALPQYGSATISPAKVTLVAGGTASSSIVFKTYAATFTGALAKPRSQGWPAVLAVTAFFFVPFGVRRRTGLLRLFAVLVAAVAMQVLVGCGNVWFYTNLVAPGTFRSR